MGSLFINLWIFIFVLFYSGKSETQEYPSDTISNRLITVKMYLPDNKLGYYRSSRFDWSGIIYELKYKGCNYFGQWNSNHDPGINDAICGPVEEFSEIGYDLTEENGEFLKIGIGGLRKPKEKKYNKFKLYEILTHGEWIINKTDYKIEFTHLIDNVSGYSYKYVKCIELVDGKPELLIKHTLENTGKRVIETNVYNHNFFTIGDLPTNQDVMIKFSKKIPKGLYYNNKSILVIDKNKIGFKRNFISNESLMLTDIFEGGLINSDIVIENKRVKAGVKITSDTKYSKIHFWASENTYCPEPYINLKLFPQKKICWTFKYFFYVM